MVSYWVKDGAKDVTVRKCAKRRREEFKRAEELLCFLFVLVCFSPLPSHWETTFSESQWIRVCLLLTNIQNPSFKVFGGQRHRTNPIISIRHVKMTSLEILIPDTYKLVVTLNFFLPAVAKMISCFGFSVKNFEI